MRILRFILIKEFKQIFRNKSLLPMIFLMPIVQLLIMPMAADYEIKNINISIVDNDRSPYSQQLVESITASGYFKLASFGNSYKEALSLVESDKADLVLEIPSGFERNLVREGSEELFMAVNAINGTKAAVGSSYLNAIINQFNAKIRLQLTQPQSYNPVPVITVASSLWYNKYMNYKLFMVPGILVILVTMVGAYMCSLNIVKEKELGTIEQINVTPIKKSHFILGKLIPFWIIGMIIFTIGLMGIARFGYGIVPLGSILLIYGFLAIYLIALLGFGLFISTYADTQQQAMSIAFFFMMVFILMSGLFTPIDSMPGWAQAIANLNPVTYFIQVMRMVVLKGSGLVDILPQVGVMIVMAIFTNTWAVLNYRKTN